MPAAPANVPPRRRTRELRQGRLSLAGTTYFVTSCTARRAALLASPAAILAGHAACRTLETTGDAAVLAATIMPDHVHLLLRLGERLPLARVIAKWKAQVHRSLFGFEWQANYFEHRLRPDEPAEPYAWYVFMNPYRARLIGIDAQWPGWWTTPEVIWSFLEKAGPRGCPLPEWLDQFEHTARSLTTGED